MTSSFSYRTNEAGFKEILGSKALSDAMVKVATPAVAEAKRTAPKRTKIFSQSFQVKPSLVPAGRKGELRAGAVVSNDAPYARYVMDDYHFRSFMWVVGQRLGGDLS